VSASDRTFVILGVVAVPVGHRVEVTVFTRDVGVVRVDLVPQPQEPLVRDLDTGVAYGRIFHFSHQEGVQPDVTLPLEARTDLEVAERVVGRVVACRVISGGRREAWHQTTLVIAPE
jgi:hypothetical protein